MTKTFNITEWARKRLKKLAKSIEKGLESEVASERIASRAQMQELADLRSMAQELQPFEVTDAHPENEKIVKMREAV